MRNVLGYMSYNLKSQTYYDLMCEASKCWLWVNCANGPEANYATRPTVGRSFGIMSCACKTVLATENVFISIDNIKHT